MFASIFLWECPSFSLRSLSGTKSGDTLLFWLTVTSLYGNVEKSGCVQGDKDLGQVEAQTCNG